MGLDIIGLDSLCHLGEADGLSVTADNFTSNPGQSLNNAQVATFTDTFTAQGAAVTS